MMIEELELMLKAVTAEADKTIDELVKTPKRSNEYNYLMGKMEAYTDMQNLVMFRLNELRKEK